MSSAKSVRYRSPLLEFHDDLFGYIITKLHIADLSSVNAVFSRAKHLIIQMLGKKLSLSSKQAQAVFQIVVLRRNTFLTGGAGAGKTHTMTKAAEMLQSIFSEKRCRLSMAQQVVCRLDCDSNADIKKKEAAADQLRRMREDPDLAFYTNENDEYEWRDGRHYYTGPAFSDDEEDVVHQSKPVLIEDMACVTFMGSAARIADSDALRASTIHLYFGIRDVRRKPTDPPVRIAHARGNPETVLQLKALPTIVINRARRIKLCALKALVIDEVQSPPPPNPLISSHSRCIM